MQIGIAGGRCRCRCRKLAVVASRSGHVSRCKGAIDIPKGAGDHGQWLVAKAEYIAWRVQGSGSSSGTSPAPSGLEPISPGVSCKLTYSRRLYLEALGGRRLTRGKNIPQATFCRSRLVRYFRGATPRPSTGTMCNSSTQSEPQDATSSSDIEPLLAAEIPQHPACTEALTLARSSLPASIFNHSFRVFMYARRARSHLADSTATFTAPPIAPHVLFVACILHDIGIADAYKADPERFEVAGANVAASLLRRHDVDVTSVREAWLAIAMHTCPHVAEGAGGLVKALRLGVRADFGIYDHLGPNVVVEGSLPRLGVEKDLGDAVVKQTLEFPLKAPGGSWPRDLTRAKEAEPEWDGINRAF